MGDSGSRFRKIPDFNRHCTAETRQIDTIPVTKWPVECDDYTISNQLLRILRFSIGSGGRRRMSQNPGASSSVTIAK